MIHERAPGNGPKVIWALTNVDHAWTNGHSYFAVPEPSEKECHRQRTTTALQLGTKDPRCVRHSNVGDQGEASSYRPECNCVGINDQAGGGVANTVQPSSAKDIITVQTGRTRLRGIQRFNADSRLLESNTATNPIDSIKATDDHLLKWPECGPDAIDG